MLKKFIALLLVLCTLTSVVYITPVALNEYEYTDNENGISITSWDKNASYTVEIPNEIDGKTVTEIEREAFENCASIYEIVIPDTVTSIDPSAFIGCASLKSITVSDNNTAYKTAEGALYTKDGKTLVKFCDIDAVEFTVPNTVTEIAPYAFYEMDKLVTVNMNGVNSVGEYAFYGCTSLKNISLSDVDDMGEYAFALCISIEYANIKTVNIPDGLFLDCKELKDVVITNAESIGKLAFAGCHSLTTVLIPNGATIGNDAFFGTDAVLYGDSTVSSYALENGNEYVNAVYTGAVQVTSISFITQTIEMRVDNILLPAVTVMPENAEVRNVVFTSLNEDVVKIIDGKFTAVGKGVATVIAKSVSGAKTAVVTVNVSDREAPLQSSHPYESGLNEKYTYTVEGEPEKIAVVFSPDTYVEEYEDFIIVMDKNNENVGTYTADQLAGKTLIINGDTVNITLISDDDVEYYGFCVTDVLPADGFVFASEIVLNETELELDYGDQYKLEYTLSPSGTLISDVHFISSDNDVVSVDPDGTVYAVNEGEAYVVVYDKVSGKSVQCSIKVNKNIFDGMHYVSDGEKITVTHYEGDAEVLTIPSEIDGSPVEMIADGAFMYSPTLKTVTIPSTVVSIADDAFAGCVNLTKINVSESNENYSSDDGVLYSKDGECLIACPGGKSGEFTVKEGVVAVGEHAFNMCVNISSITLSSTVELLAQTSFDYCEKLTAFAVDDSDHFSVYDGVLYTDDMKAVVHYPCGKTGQYVMPESVEIIKEGAFNSVSLLTEITISKNLSAIEDGALSHVEKLQTIFCHEDNPFFTSVYGVLYSKDKKDIVCCPAAYIGEFLIEDGVENIGEYAFSMCMDVTEVFMPSTINKIGKYAFYGADGIAQIILPSSVTSIGEGAFDNCSNVRIFAPDTVATIGNSNGSAVVLCSEDSQTWSKAQQAGYETEHVTYSSTESGIAIYYGDVPNGFEFDAVTCKKGKQAVLQALFPDDKIIAVDVSFDKYFTSQDYTALIYTDKMIEAVYRIENGEIEEVQFFTAVNGVSFQTSGGTYVLVYGARIDNNESIAFRALPDKLEYNYGEAFEKDGISVYFKNNAGIVTVLDDGEYTIEAPTLDMGGNHSVKVTYGTCDAEFTVTVMTEPLTAELSIEGELILGGKITAVVKNINFDYIPYEITWYRNGELIEGAKGNEYTLTGADGGKDISAKMTAINGCEGEALSNVLHVGVFEISTDVYTINKELSLISKINEQTTVDEFISNLSFSDGVKAYKGDEELTGEDLITTGTEIRLYSGEVLVSTVTAVVTGDINGDGKISLIDFSNIKAYMLGDKEFTSFDQYAADANGDGKLSLIDFSQFKAHMLGDLTIEGKEY